MPDPEPPGPLRARVLGAHAAVRRGREEWREVAAPGWAADGRAAERWVPSIEVWVEDAAPVHRWLAAAGDDVGLEIVPGGREDVDVVVCVFHGPEVVDLDVAVPTALIEVTARACTASGDPVLLCLSTATAPLDEGWWARTPLDEPDLVMVLDPAELQASVVAYVARSVDIVDVDALGDLGDIGDLGDLGDLS